VKANELGKMADFYEYAFVAEQRVLVEVPMAHGPVGPGWGAGLTWAMSAGGRRLGQIGKERTWSVEIWFDFFIQRICVKNKRFKLYPFKLLNQTKEI
jgi:hypothetical protein